MVGGVWGNEVGAADMTTIVYKDGVLAGDTLISEGDHFYGHRSKIFDLELWIVGIAGASMLYDEFLKFVMGHEFNKEAFKAADLQFKAIVIDKHTKKVSCYEKELIEDGDIKTDFIAFGSGAAIAKGALLMGATAKQAVECAAKLDHYTGGEIQEIKV